MTEPETGGALLSMYKGLFIVSLILLGSAFVKASPNAEISKPEFECTVLERNTELKGNALQRIHESLSLRSFATGDWLYSNQGKSHRLPKESVQKKTDVEETATTYEMSHNKMRIFLSGRPPSRVGLIWEIGNPPMEPRFLAKVTCH